MISRMLRVTHFRYLLSVFLWVLQVGGTDVSGSYIETFRDKTCVTSLNNFNGPDGYPDGTCTSLNLKPLQSFQVVGLDPGCTGE